MAGNKNSGRRAGGKDFAPRVRSMVDRVLAGMYETGKAEKLLKEAFEEDFVGTLQKVAPYAPKQVEAQITTRSPEEWLELMAEHNGSQSESTEPANTVPGQVH